MGYRFKELFEMLIVIADLLRSLNVEPEGLYNDEMRGVTTVLMIEFKREIELIGLAVCIVIGFVAVILYRLLA